MFYIPHVFTTWLPCSLITYAFDDYKNQCVGRPVAALDERKMCDIDEYSL